MLKKTMLFFLSFCITILFSTSIFADVNMSAKNSEKGKVIVINMNKTNLENMQKIKFLNLKLKDGGYVGLMNIRSDNDYNEVKNYASMGSTGRVNIFSHENYIFENSTEDQGKIFEAATGLKPGKINLNDINLLKNYNKDYGKYESILGELGQTIEDNNKKLAVFGNSDLVKDGNLVKNRNFCLTAMDNNGRIFRGNVDDINKVDLSMPYGISTDYEKLMDETKSSYNENDLLFIDLGDTYRLDEYSKNLNEQSYNTMQKNIYKNISEYLKNVFSVVDKNDTIYILGDFPSNIDYKNKRRLAPVIKFDMSNNSKGLLSSASTRRTGVISNLDISAEILNELGLSNDKLSGKIFKSIDNQNNIEDLNKLYKKIVSISTIRLDIINIYVPLVAVSWLIGAIALAFREKICKQYRKKVFKILKVLIKLGLVMPLAFLAQPIFGATSGAGIAITIALLTVIFCFIGSKVFKSDISEMGFFALLMIVLIVIDSVIGTPFMQTNIMSYDPIVGARYYGIGNEYEGVTIGSAVLAVAILIRNKKIPKFIGGIFLLIVLFTSAYPGMGANVGGAISEFVAYVFFILFIYNIKIDVKRIIAVFLGAAVLVGVFAFIDIKLELNSHLGQFVKLVLENGIGEVISTFSRKIAMNIQLAQSTVWINVLLVGLIILMAMLLRPTSQMAYLKKDYPIILKCYLAIMIGCLVTLLVNDSGIIAAATASLYILVPLLIININKNVFEES